MPARDLRPNSLYILLSYLRPASDGYKYHWGLLLTGPNPSSHAGQFFHATDAGRGALDLYRQDYPTRSGMLQSQYSVCVLYIGQINPQALVQATQDNVTGLMNPRALPRHERQWTCRVWVETVLNYAASQRWIQLPAGMSTIELGALATADHCRAYMGNAVVISDYSWINRRDRVPCASSSSSRTTPMDIDSTGTRRRDHGGSKPMQGVEHYGRSSRSRR